MSRWLVLGLSLSLLSAPALSRAEGLHNLYAAINGIAVAPTDPLYYTIAPPEDLNELPLAPVTRHLFGLPAGVGILAQRLILASFDVVATPLWVAPVLSREPDFFTLIPNVEYRD